MRSLLAENLLSQMPALADVERIEPAAITAVHLWFDRPITRLPHAVLVGRLSQWLFAWCRHRACQESSRRDACTTILLSGGHQRFAPAAAANARPMAGRGPRRVGIGLAGGPAGAAAARPGGDAAGGRVLADAGSGAISPAAANAARKLALAGDWTATGWPATMEGAVRSGRQAVESLFAGRSGRELTPRR